LIWTAVLSTALCFTLFFFYLIEELAGLRIPKHGSSNLGQQALVGQSQAAVQRVIAHNAAIVRGQHHSSRAKIHSFFHLIFVGRQKHCRVYRRLHFPTSLLSIFLQRKLGKLMQKKTKKKARKKITFTAKGNTASTRAKSPLRQFTTADESSNLISP
jgi:hypothetical protein